jgi:hypothetical protein
MQLVDGGYQNSIHRSRIIWTVRFPNTTPIVFFPTSMDRMRISPLGLTAASRAEMTRPTLRITMAGFFSFLPPELPLPQQRKDLYSRLGLVRSILGDTGVPYDWDYGDHAGKG